MQETGSPQLQETFMHRVSAIVHCTAAIQYYHNRNRVSLYYLFQENKSFGTNYHLHSSSDVREVVSSTVIMGRKKIFLLADLKIANLFQTTLKTVTENNVSKLELSILPK
jgi:hypothetical protein